MSFDIRVIDALREVVGWRQPDDPQIPNLTDTTLLDSLSGREYQDYHPLVTIENIQLSMPSYEDLEDRLYRLEKQAINNSLNSIIAKNSIKQTGTVIASSDIILNSVVRGNTIVNSSYFVGIEICLGDNIGISTIINRIGLYTTVAQTGLTFYLFNSLQSQPIRTFTYNSSNANSFQWKNERIVMDYDSGAQDNGLDTSGGFWYLGYYQDDLSGQAIQYDQLNWKNGWCSCKGKSRYQNFNSVTKDIGVTLSPFYVASGNYVVGELFDTDVIHYNYTNNWGLNLSISAVCNISQYWIDNRINLESLIGNSVALEVLKFIANSNEVSGTEQNIQILALRAIEGDTQTKAERFSKKVERAAEVVRLDAGNNNNSPCLPCSYKGTTITTA